MKTTTPLAILMLATVAMTTGCASITNSKNQPISVVAVCDGNAMNGASCTLSNDKGAWFTPTPGSLMVQKSSGDMVVSCRKEQATGSITFPSRANASVWGNLLVGGIIGYAIDAGSGSGFDYPTNVTVFMQGPCSGAAQPSMTPSQSGVMPMGAPAPTPNPLAAPPVNPGQAPQPQSYPPQQQAQPQTGDYPQQQYPQQQYPAPVVPQQPAAKPKAPKSDNWYLY